MKTNFGFLIRDYYDVYKICSSVETAYCMGENKTALERARSALEALLNNYRRVKRYPLSPDYTLYKKIEDVLIETSIDTTDNGECLKHCCDYIREMGRYEAHGDIMYRDEDLFREALKSLECLYSVALFLCYVLDPWFGGDSAGGFCSSIYEISLESYGFNTDGIN